MAELLGISISKADQLLSRPDTNEILQKALHDSIQVTLFTTLSNMARTPHETVPTRVDCVVECPLVPPANPGIVPN
jgi:hypothetical protein